MKTFTFSTLFAFLATSMVVQGMAPAPDSKYQSYVSRLSTPGSVSVNENAVPNCQPGSDYCVFTYINSEGEYQKYSLYTLDGTTATTNHIFTVNKGSYNINQWSGNMWSDKPVRILMTCGKGNGQEVDPAKGWGTVSFQKGYASFNTYNGAQARFGNDGPWITASQSNSDVVVEFACPSVKH